MMDATGADGAGPADGEGASGMRDHAHDHGHGHGRFPGLGRTEVTRAEELVPVGEHLDHVARRVPSFEPIELRAEETLGLVLAEDVVGEEPVPAFANSAMDGYAVDADDVAGAGPEDTAVLEVVGEVLAGAGELPEVEPGTTVRIMTGAPLPPGADAVVPVETTRRAGVLVHVHAPVAPGRHVRGVGEDISPGEQLLSAGRRIRPADVGLLAAVGRSRVLCYPAPRVGVVTTGDELVPAHRTPGPGQIRDANGPMLAALVRQAGGIPHRTGPVGDDRSALTEALDSAVGHVDLVVATGGASVGTHDLLAESLARLGTVTTAKVAMKPGKPQVFGVVGGVPVFGLPGNPVSALVSFEVFVRPTLRTFQGRRDHHRPAVVARAAEPLPGAGPRRHYLRVRLREEDGGWLASPTGHQGSHVLTSVVRADGLAEIPAGTEEVAAGEAVTVHLLVEG